MNSMDETIPPGPEPAEPGPDAAPDSLCGTVLDGRYRVEALVGTGGMGKVYRAHQLALERPVAIKLLHPELLRSPERMERFRREALVAARLRHPNIVTVYDFETTPDGHVYLVMEYLPGAPLDARIEARAVGAPSEVVGILKPVCSAVDALHRAGIVHRDIKPSNIMMPPEGGGDDVIKVVDFGIARLTEVDGGTDLTGQHVVGTAEYIAPELIDGKAKADARSDVYALGATAYEVITGRPPFVGETNAGVLRQHLVQDPPRAGDVVKGLPPEVDRALAKALAKDPAERFQTAGELAAALERAFEAGAGGRRTSEGLPAAVPEVAEGREAPVAILVVDDERQICNLLSELLAAEGYDVTVASDGVEALMCLGRRDFDLIVSDIDMPNLDGFSLLKFKTEKGVTTPVIFLTGRDNNTDEVRGFDLGAEDFIRKPMDLDVLLARVRRALARSARRTE
jgi:CheY-like chemotaxis protein/tRNA A-37 threonylcarbamoyl transferase component Bud32